MVESSGPQVEVIRKMNDVRRNKTRADYCVFACVSVSFNSIVTEIFT